MGHVGTPSPCLSISDEAAEIATDRARARHRRRAVKMVGPGSGSSTCDD